MALVDHDRRFAAVNGAALELYQYPRDEIVGRPAGSGMPDQDPAVADAEWSELVRTGELYGERLVRGSGPDMRVAYAAHATHIDGQWLALFVVLSAHVEPQGDELVSPLAPGAQGDGAPSEQGSARSRSRGTRLTPREREIVHRVALGRSTPQIAVDLNLSPATVRSHVRNAMVKTGAHTRAQLVALALGKGLVDG